MSNATEWVLEVGRQGSQHLSLSTQLVRKTGLKDALRGERPKFLLAYHHGRHGASGAAGASARAQDFRLQVLQNLLKSKSTADRDAIRMRVTVVPLPTDHWRREVERRVRSLGATDVLYFVDSNAEPKGPKKTPPSPGDPLMIARARRDRVLTQGRWYTAPEVANLLNGAIARSNPSQYASTLRRQRRLLGVLHKGEFLHPEFQFNASTGALRRETAQLLQVLPKDATGWGAALWCFQPTGRLGRRRPADVFATGAKAVIAAAKQDFEGDDGNW